MGVLHLFLIHLAGSIISLIIFIYMGKKCNDIVVSGENIVVVMVFSWVMVLVFVLVLMIEFLVKEEKKWIYKM